MTDVDQDKGSVFFLRAGSTIAFLAAAGLVIFGRSLLGALELLKGPIEHFADDLTATLAFAALYALGVVLAQQGLANAVARRGVSGFGKKMLTFQGLLTTIGAIGLLVGFWQARTGLYRRGGPYVPSPARLESTVRMGLTSLTVGFSLITAGRGIAAFVARSIRKSPIQPCWVSPSIRILRMVAFLTVTLFLLLMASSCKHGQTAATIASASRNQGALEAIRAVSGHLDILLQHAIGAGLCLGLLGLMEMLIGALCRNVGLRDFEAGPEGHLRTADDLSRHLLDKDGTASQVGPSEAKGKPNREKQENRERRAPGDVLRPPIND